ncbi:MAG: flippase [Chlorobium sp.]|nr:flippase [Chlorobium sp.]
MSLKRNTLWNLFGSGAPFLLGVVTIPYLLRHAGVEAFGILTLIWALIGYFSLFDFGLGRALTQQIAANRASGQIEELPSLVKTGLLFILVTGAIGGLLLAVVSNQLGFKWLNVSIPLQQSTVYSLLIASIGIPMTTITTGLKGVLEAYEDFKAANMLRLLLGVANFGLPVLSVMAFGPSLPMMVSSLIVARFVVMGAHLYLVYNKLPAGWIKAKFNKKKMKGLLTFGAWMTMSNIVSPLMVVADRFIISSILGASLVAYYTVPSDFLIRILIIPGALSAALFPRLTSLMNTNRIEAKNLYSKSLKVVTLTMLPICASIAICSFWGLSLWLGQEFSQHSWKIASILAVGLLLNSIAHIPYAAVQASGNARVTALLHVGEFTFYIPLLFLFLHLFGLPGAAIIWVIRVGADLLLLLKYANKAHNRKLT